MTENPASSQSSQVDTIILGGGITGLTAAWSLSRQGKSTVLLEKRSRLGGAVETVHRDGFLIETGPNTLLLDRPELTALFDRLQLTDAMLAASPAAKKRFIVRKGKPAALPDSPRSFLTGPWLSLPGKLRLASEPLLARRPTGDDESVASFFRRHLGESAFAYLVDPFVSGIHSGDPAMLSMQAAFPGVFKMGREHRSIILGFMKAGRQAKKSASPPFKKSLVSFRDGLGSLVEALSRQATTDFRLGSTVQKITQAAESAWQVTATNRDGTTQAWQARQLVIALPPTALPDLPLPEDVKLHLAPVARATAPGLVSLALGFRRSQVGHPLDGFGLLAPSVEQRKILGVLFSSTLFPGRAPDGQVLLSAFLGGARNAEVTGLSDGELIDQVVGDLRELLTIGGDPSVVHLTRWPRAIPQYNLGYSAIQDALRSATRAFPGLLFRGNAVDGISLPNCLASGLSVAED